MMGVPDRLRGLRRNPQLPVSLLPAYGSAAAVLAAVSALSLAHPAFANDPPYRMEEMASDSSHVGLLGKGIWGYADGKGEYALVATGGTLAVIDVTDAAHPVIATQVPSTGADLKEVKTYKHYAYCVNQLGPLQIVDLSDPYHAYTVANYRSDNIYGCHNIWLGEDGYAYLALQGTGTQDLRILDFTKDPLNAVERGHYTLSQNGGYISAHDVYVRSDTCYVSWFGGGLVILDVSDKDFPQLITHINYPSAATHNAWPTLDGRYVCTTDEQNGGHLRIWELRGHPDIQQVAEYSTEAIAIIHNVHLKGPYAYIAYYTAGVRVVDLSNPLQPEEIGRFDTSRLSGGRFGGCWSVFPFAPSGLIYSSDMQSGLYVLRFLDARDGVVRGEVVAHGTEAAPVEGAEVRFKESEVRVVSDHTGYFQAHLYQGTHTGVVTAPGFHTETFTTTIGTDQAVTLTVVLDPLPGALEFVEEPDQPRMLPDGRLAIEARVRAHSSPVTAVTLHFRAGGTGSFRAVPMEQVASDDDRYRAFVPELLPGVLLQYFFEAEDGSRTVFLPAEAPAGMFSYRAGKIDWQTIFSANFENDAAGFTVGSPDDYGEHGFWERAIPVAGPLDSLLFGNGRVAQPPTDASPAGPGYCFLTEAGVPGDSPNAHSVSGRTTLTSPTIALDLPDGSPAAAAWLRLTLWYVNDIWGSRWQDPFLIEGSTDDGASWLVLESIRAIDPGWQGVAVDLGRRLDLRRGRVQIRFVAEDTISPTLIEAAVDDIDVEVTGGIRLDAVPGPIDFVLLRQNIPNPFNPSTIITYQLKEPRQVRLAIYDVAGHLVKILADQVEPVGDHALTWDGKDVRGFQSPSGVYYYRLDTQGLTETRTMMLVK